MKNATIIEDSKTQILYSYSTPVVIVNKSEGRVYVTTHKHSVTTSKHINQFLAKLPSVNALYVSQSEIDAMCPVVMSISALD